MAGFLAAFAAPWIALFVWNMPHQFHEWLHAGFNEVIAIPFLVAPLMSSWFTAILVHHHWPRRLFTPHPGALTVSIRQGFISGVGSIVATALLLLIDTSQFPDWSLTAAASVFTTGLTLLLSKRVQPGRCQICSYDLCSSLQFGRCPECGTAFA